MPRYFIPLPVLFVLETLGKAGHEAYIVGGAVRDLLAGREKILDWDVTTRARPEEVLKLLTESFYDNNFGTVMVAPKHLAKQMGRKNLWEEWEVFDITTFRSEFGYSDNRRPDKVIWGKTLEEDLQRRDFTINAMALKVKDEGFGTQDLPEVVGKEVEVEIIDPYKGRNDLEKKLIRTVGDANRRFEEDALRMMRAIRFGAQLGFRIEAVTLEAIKQNSERLANISWERIRDELLKIMASDYPADGVALMKSSGLLKQVLPEMLATVGVKQGGHHVYDVWTHSLESLRHCPSSDPIVRLATFLHDVGKPVTARKQGPRGVTFYGHEVVGAGMVKQIAERLRLSKKQKEKLFILVRWHMFHYQPEMTDAAIRRLIRRIGKENINEMIMLRIGDRKGGGSRATSWRLRELQKRIGENLYEPMSVRDLKINGHDLMGDFKLNPGPVLGKILNQLFEEVMADKLANEKTVLMQRARELLEESKASV